MKKGARAVGLILAGGLAKRMGECKALLPIEGASALAQIVVRMRAAGVGRILVVTGGHAERVQKETARLECAAVFNPAYETGMFSSVTAGVGALPKDTEAFFLIPVDIPLVKTATYRTLMDAFYDGFGSPDVVYPTFGGVRGHPPLIGRTMIGHILSWGGARGLRGLLEEHPNRAQEVPTGDRATQLDMDTPDDYATLLRYAKTEAFPDEAECGELLEIAGTPLRAVRHARMVARCGILIAGAIARGGVKLNKRAILSTCLLHDLAKGEREHEARGARWLRKRGYDKVARIVATHKDLPERDAVGEAEVLYLADKITDGEIVSTLANRMMRMEARFAPESEALQAARRRIYQAMAIQRRVEEIAGEPLGEILDRARSRYPQNFLPI